MSKTERQLIDGLRELTKAPAPVKYGTVERVDEQAWTCDVSTPDGALIAGVQLKAISGQSTAVVTVPKVGSEVQLLRLSLDTWLMVAAQEAQKVYLNAADGVQVLDGSNGGVPISANIAGRLQQVEQDLNNLRKAIQAWVPVPQDGGASLKAVGLLSWLPQQLSLTQSSDLENTDFTH